MTSISRTLAEQLQRMQQFVRACDNVTDLVNKIGRDVLEQPMSVDHARTLYTKVSHAFFHCDFPIQDEQIRAAIGDFQDLVRIILNKKIEEEFRVRQQEKAGLEEAVSNLDVVIAELRDSLGRVENEEKRSGRAVAIRVLEEFSKNLQSQIGRGEHERSAKKG